MRKEETIIIRDDRGTTEYRGTVRAVEGIAVCGSGVVRQDKWVVRIPGDVSVGVGCLICRGKWKRAECRTVREVAYNHRGTTVHTRLVCH